MNLIAELKEAEAVLVIDKINKEIRPEWASF